MKIIVDADSCPVKNEITDLGKKHNLEIVFVFSTSHFSNYDKAIKVIMVDNVSQAADMKIANIAAENDIVVTQDYGVAAMVMARKAKVILNNGKIVDKENINVLLGFRHVNEKLRNKRIRVKGPKKFSTEDREYFKNNLEFLITGTEGE